MCQGSSISNRRDQQYRFLNNLEYSKVSEHRFWFFNDSEMMDISREWTTILICQYHEMGTCLRWYFKGLITDTFFWTILTMSEEWSWTIENLECIRRVLSTDSDFLIILKYWTYQGSKYQFLFVVRRSVRRWVPTLVASNTSKRRDHQYLFLNYLEYCMSGEWAPILILVILKCWMCPESEYQFLFWDDSWMNNKYLILPSNSISGLWIIFAWKSRLWMIKTN